MQKQARPLPKDNSLTTVKILMVDDHPSQIEGYKAILNYNLSGAAIDITECYCCKKAYSLISLGNHYDVVFLDSNMPPVPMLNIQSGEDLVGIIRKHLPKCKIAILTSHSETFKLYHIVKNVAPNALLVKSDFSATDLLVAFDAILNGDTFHTDTVLRKIKEFNSNNNFLDSYNRQIISLLARGIRTRTIPEYLHLSLSAIEKRKVQIKDYLCLEGARDEDIVAEARRRGFV